MQTFGPSSLVGRYFRPRGGVVSVFWNRDGTISRLVRRYWTFLITHHSAGGIKCINISSGHQVTLRPGEILSCTGDLDAPAHHMRPLTFTLASQLCWDAMRVWREHPTKLAFVH